MKYSNLRRRSSALTLATLTSLLTFLTLFTPLPAHGQANPFPPGKMTFQGFLTDAATPPVPLGNTSPENKSVIFKIYKNPTSTAAGDVLWAEQQIVTIDKGHFSVLLGEGSSVSGQPHSNDLSSVFIGADASERWLGITVDDSEITPRIQFFAAPYAQLARAANSLVSGATFNGSAQIGTAANPAFPLEFGAGKSGKEANAGKIGYETLTTGALDIIGAGTAVGSRAIKLWDDVTVNGNLGIGTPASSTTPLRFGSGFADTKLALWDDGGTATYGLGVQSGQFRQHLNSASSRFSFLSAPNGTEVMTIKGDGLVGIGKSAPGARLHVAGNANVLNIEGTDHAYIQWFPHGASAGRKGWMGWGGAGGNDFTIRNEISGGHIILSTGGNVGIGTFTPQAPLEVSGSVNHTKTYRYVNKSVGPGGPATANVPYSILASRFIGCEEINVFSDARIKTVLGLSDKHQDLETIQKLRVTDYRMVDTVEAGEAVRKGFIAQEVETIIPEAVTSTPRFVPDIYSLPSSFQFEEQKQTLAVALPKPHGLKAGDRVRIMSDESQLELNVTGVPSETEFVVGKVQKAPKQLFVYGKQVPDFRTLNYDRIFTTGIGAIQELARQVEALQKSEARIAELEQKTERMAELEQKAARVDSLERQVAELTKLVAALAQGQAQTERLAGKNTGTPAGD